MSYAENPYQSFGLPADQVDVDARVDFIRKTYAHLAGAVLGFAVICGVLLQLEPVQKICETFVQTPMMYLVAMFGLMAVSWVCEKWAAQSASIGTQYAGLAVYTVAEAIFFLPMLWIADRFFPGAIMSAGVITGAVFAGLTLSVFITRADFSFMRSALCIAGFAALGIGVGYVLLANFGQIEANSTFSLVLMGAFVLIAAGYILYQTSMVLHHYPIGMHVAAALALFASLTTLFWYVLQIVMRFSNRD